MSIPSSAPTSHTTIRPGFPARGAIAERLSDYLELTKPRIAVMALISVAVGYALASTNGWQWLPLAHALCGIGLIAVACSVLNQFVERATDAQMDRTANRPLPSGRVAASEALCLGLAAAFIGLCWLLFFVNTLTAMLSLTTLLLYVAVYTPLKRFSSICTTVGAVPGALPPVLGWTAAGGSLDAGAFSLFALLFVWQFPHFLAIGWLHQVDYAEAGLKMLPPVPQATGVLAVVYAIALIPVSLLPERSAIAGDVYLLTAVLLGIGYLAAAVRFSWKQSRETARGLLFSSLVYLPLVLLALTWDHFRLLR